MRDESVLDQKPASPSRAGLAQVVGEASRAAPLSRAGTADPAQTTGLTGKCWLPEHLQ